MPIKNEVDLGMFFYIMIGAIVGSLYAIATQLEHIAKALDVLAGITR